MISRKKVFNLITKVAIFTALSYLFYFIKFSIPSIFPFFLEIQFSNVPAILGGLILGPVGGSLIVIIRFLFKLLSTTSLGIGEIVDLIIGLSVVLSSSIYYLNHKTKKGGLISLIIAFAAWIISACLLNAYVTLPFYIDKFFGGTPNYLEMIKAYIPNVTESNYMVLTIFGIILPFNALLASIICLITFIVYKKVSIVFKNDLFK